MSDARDRPGRRKEGRALIVALHGASRVMKLYPLEHQGVQRAINDVVAVAHEIQQADHELECRVQGEFIFVNGTRLRLDLTNYASFGNVLTLFRESEIGGIKVATEAASRDWLMLLSLLSSPTKAPEDERLHSLSVRLAAEGVTVFELEPPTDGDGDEIGKGEVQAAAQRTYTQSVAISKEVINSVRMGRAPSLKRLKRAVQGIVDQVLTEETSLIGLTALRDYDEYTYTHCVNVCIFSVALGKRLGMSKVQLYELGFAAVLHDIGKSRVPIEVLQKSTGLEDDDWRVLMGHPWMGLLALCQLRGSQEFPYRSMLVAHEHHMKCDLTGYPHPLRPRTLGMVSRIVSVADAYDAATTRRAYQSIPHSPANVLQELRDNPRRGTDPVVVKAFINLLGIYPVGTLVVLDTFELAVVRGANPNPELLSRPSVMIVSDALGNLVAPPLLADLAVRRADGEFARTIIKTADPERYGVRVSDYLLG
ncbi:MAG TPA: HD domain-containing phosphohydrolase [Gemmatimonadaceae bacterium]|jgi:HD-GYP domain-containing protein (c-di-GMP phosphodiesterase class II)|nr:HD domain-containing phosphohydrolase [Gemmatimonadaceae bacterium]